MMYALGMLITKEEIRLMVKALRGNQSQAEFGKRFEVTRQAVNRWENGTAIPPKKVLRELAIEKCFVKSNIGRD